MPRATTRRAHLFAQLLVTDKTKRLGCLKNGVNDIKEHKCAPLIVRTHALHSLPRLRYFHEFSWDALLAKRITPPWVPSLVSMGDTSNFGEYVIANLRSVPLAH